MTVFEFTIYIFLISYATGIFGSLTGLGGGIVITPVLVLFFKIDIHYAMGASLVAVIATSSGAALSFVRSNLTNVKIGMFLEMGAVIGAIIGALIVRFVPVSLISIILGVVLLISVWFSLQRHVKTLKSSLNTEPNIPENLPEHPWAQRLGLEGQYKVNGKLQHYQVYRLPLGLFLMTIAGTLSGLLGIGSGALKVLAMDLAMGLPYKVSTSTSNFMIGMTAAASMGVYFNSGYINAEITFPVMLGVLLGALTGGRILISADVKILRMIFAFVVVILAIQMILKGFGLII